MIAQVQNVPDKAPIRVKNASNGSPFANFLPQNGIFVTYKYVTRITQRHLSLD
jgi:hypothetical protein